MCVLLYRLGFLDWLRDVIVLVSDHCLSTVELQWLEHVWDHENMFETWVVRAKEC